MSIAIIVLTQNRVQLLAKCVERALMRTSAATAEIVIWDNASTDGTAAFLDAIDDPRVRVVHNQVNIGQNAYAEAVKLTNADYLIELDDDVTDAPQDWDAALLNAFTKLDGVGFLAADLEDDPNDTASHIRHHVRADEYREEERNGVRLLVGPTGGGCAMTSRRINDLVGGFPQQKGRSFYLEDEAYIHAIARHGFGAAILRDLRVHHTGGAFYANSTPEKDAYWARVDREQRRKAAIKRLLLALPFVRSLNHRHGWFVEPDRNAPASGS